MLCLAEPVPAASRTRLNIRLEGHVDVSGPVGGHEDRTMGIGVGGYAGRQSEVLRPARPWSSGWIGTSRSARLRCFDDQHVVDVVDVVDAQVQCFPDPQPRGGEQPDDRAERRGDPLVAEHGSQAASSASRSSWL